MSEVPTLPDLTLPLRDTSTLRQVQHLHARVLLRDLTTLPARPPADPLGPFHDRVGALVRDLLARDPRRIVRILRLPTVQAVLGAARRQPKDPRWRLELDLLLLLELAAAGDLPELIQAPRCAWPVLRSPSANLELTVAPDVEALAFDNGRLFARRGEHEQPFTFGAPTEGPLLTARAAYHPIADRILLATTDNNPLANVQAHPERAGNRLDLGDRAPSEWVDALREAFALIDAHLPLVAEEMRLLLQVVTPVGFHPERHFSCSFEESVGAISLTLHPSPMVLAEALIHEFQHNKLNAVFRFDPLLHDAHAAVHRSPVRPDLRPLHGVLMAVHAFQPVARLYENMTRDSHSLSRGRDWPRRFRDVLRINREGAQTVLQHGRPTALGRQLVAEMKALEDHFRAYELLQWPPAAVGNA